MLLRSEAHEFSGDVFSCLKTKSCVEGKMGGKNELVINSILTSGTYKILILNDPSSNHESDHVPITFGFDAFPIVQNEER